MSRSKSDGKLVLLPGSENAYDASADSRNNVIGKRLLEARKRAGLTQKELSEALAEVGIHITFGCIAKWESGQTLPNAYQLVAACQVLGLDESISYFTSRPKAPFLNEEGERRLREYREDLIASGRYSPEPVIEAPPIRYREMRLYSAGVSAGCGNFLEDGDYELVPFPESAIKEGADFALRIAGNSMEPAYRDGQTIWVQSCDRLQPGEEGVFLYDGEAYFKVLGEREIVEEENGVSQKQRIPVLISYNPAYPPRPVSPELGFRIVGRVL